VRLFAAKLADQQCDRPSARAIGVQLPVTKQTPGDGLRVLPCRSRNNEPYNWWFNALLVTSSLAASSRNKLSHDKHNDVVETLLGCGMDEV
jgi:hypothetical protein